MTQAIMTACFISISISVIPVSFMRHVIWSSDSHSNIPLLLAKEYVVIVLEFSGLTHCRHPRNK